MLTIVSPYGIYTYNNRAGHTAKLATIRGTAMSTKGLLFFFMAMGGVIFTALAPYFGTIMKLATYAR